MKLLIKSKYCTNRTILWLRITVEIKTTQVDRVISLAQAFSKDSNLMHQITTLNKVRTFSNLIIRKCRSL